MNSREFLYSKAEKMAVLSNKCNKIGSLRGSDPMPFFCLTGRI